MENSILKNLFLKMHFLFAEFNLNSERMSTDMRFIFYFGFLTMTGM